MRDYIILNGVNSNTITGLLISKLPPITKPKQRTTVEEIDGRDGDIVTKLGYSAYDKEIQIGLYGDFDIDDVMTFFNGEGTVTFSNEEDKYYNYQILDQIDYEKLIRFKTAKVKMHVQPFKYPLEETPAEITIQNVTGSGENIDLDNTAEAPVTLALNGNTSQEKTEGYNLYYMNYNDTTNSNWNGVTIVSTKTGYKITGTATANGAFTLVGRYMTLPAGTYTIKTKKTNNLKVGLSKTDYTSVITITVGTAKASFTLSQETIVCLTLGITSGATYNEENEVMVYQGTTDKNFEPYTNGASPNPDYPQEVHIVTGDNIITIENSDSSENQNYHITLPEGTELCKIGDYQDIIYKDSGKWYIERKIGKTVLNGTETWLSWASQTLTNTNLFGTNIIDNISKIGYVGLSNYFTNSSTTIWATDIQALQVSASGENQLRIRVNKTIAEGTTDLKNWLASNNVTVYYVLTTPTTTEITDQELITQLEAINNARSYDPITHITQNTADKPFIINATAVQKGTDTGVVDNEGNIYSKPTIDIEGTGTAEIYLNNNQIFSVDLSTYNECIIDTTNLEAYNPATSQLMNRQVTGDYSNFKLNAGENQIKISGAVTKATISNYTRWL